jgi:nitroreductase
LKEGVYLYDAIKHALTPIASGDHRADIGMARPAGAGRPGGPAGPPGGAPAGAPSQAQPTAPKQPETQAGGATPSYQSVVLLLVSDNSRFGGGTDAKKFEWGAIDTGIVAQNAMLFCAANGLVTHPRASIDESKLKTLLGLKDTQHVHLELPIGYPKE